MKNDSLLENAGCNASVPPNGFINRSESLKTVPSVLLWLWVNTATKKIQFRNISAHSGIISLSHG